MTGQSETLAEQGTRAGATGSGAPGVFFDKVMGGGGRLETLTLAYLAFPWLLFFAGWLRGVYGLPLCLLLILGVIWCVRGYGRLDRGMDTERVDGSRGDYVLALVLVAAWLVVAGVGEFVSQVPDYVKHNAILAGLAEKDWPVAYVLELNNLRIPTALVYYIAYYLPPAALGDMLPWKGVAVAQAAWTGLGLWLAMLWWFRNTGRARGWVALFFILFSGADLLGHLLFKSGEVVFFSLEWWNGYWQYSSNMTMLFWVPQHALPGWLVMGLFLDRQKRVASGGRAGNVALPCALCCLWSPFIAMGTAPFAAVLAFRDLRSQFRLETLAAVSIAVVCFLYYTSLVKGAVPAGWAWNEADPAALAPAYAALVLIEILPIALLPLLLVRGGPGGRFAVAGWTALAVLLLLPAYRFGNLNDLGMRGSMPALYATCLLCFHAVFSPGQGARRSWLRWVLAACLLVGTAGPVSLVGKQLMADRKIGHAHLTELDVESESFRLQYLALQESFFFSVMARQP